MKAQRGFGLLYVQTSAKVEYEIADISHACACAARSLLNVCLSMSFLGIEEGERGGENGRVISAKP